MNDQEDDVFNELSTPVLPALDNKNKSEVGAIYLKLKVRILGFVFMYHIEQKGSFMKLIYLKTTIMFTSDK